MTDLETPAHFRRDVQTWTRERLEQFQLERLNQLLHEVIPINKFYQRKFGSNQLQVSSLADWNQLPTTSKTEWINADPSGVALHHSFAESHYRRYHRTSGTHGKPMVILDTEADWKWWIDTWQYVLDGCQITSHDRVMMAFSFGPFIGFWSAHDACLKRKCMVIPCGGMSTLSRIELIHSACPTVIFSTPSYAIHLGQEAQRRGLDLNKSSIRCVFVAGEAGGSVRETRSTIESLYGAAVMDHAGATEVGPWGFSSSDGQALHVIESEFIAEFLPPESNEQAIQLASANDKEPLKEMVLTSLGRRGAPVFRYRTGDLVRPVFDSHKQTGFVRLNGGVAGRVDEMFVVRGVNIFPSSIDAIVRSFPEIGEYRLVVSKNGALDQLELQIEDRLHDPIRVAERFLVQLNLRIDVVDVTDGSLLKAEGKARRIIDHR